MYKYKKQQQPSPSPQHKHPTTRVVYCGKTIFELIENYSMVVFFLWLEKSIHHIISTRRKFYLCGWAARATPHQFTVYVRLYCENKIYCIDEPNTTRKNYSISCTFGCFFRLRRNIVSFAVSFVQFFNENFYVRMLQFGRFSSLQESHLMSRFFLRKWQETTH